MKQENGRNDVIAAIGFLGLAMSADSNTEARRHYNTAEKLAKHGGIDIHVIHTPTSWPPAALAKAYLNLALKCLDLEGDK